MDGGAGAKTYKIGQAAKMLDVKPFVLRFWEGEFKDVLVPVRTPSGQRAYTEHNVETVRRIKALLYDEGLTIEGAKKRLVQSLADSPANPLPRQDKSPSIPAAEAARPTVEAVLSPVPMSTSAQPAAAPPTRREESLAAALRELAGELAAIRDLLK